MKTEKIREKLTLDEKDVNRVLENNSARNRIFKPHVNMTRNMKECSLNYKFLVLTF